MRLFRRVESDDSARGSLAANVVSLYAIQGLNSLLPLVTLPFILRALRPSGYGSVVFAQALFGYAVLVVEFGFNLHSAREISMARQKPAEIARIYWTTMAAKGLLLVGCGVLIAALVLFVPAFRRDWLVFAASGLLLLGNVAFPQWYLQGLERLREAAATQLLAKIAAAVCLITLVRTPDDTVIAAVFLSGPQVLAVLAAVALRIRLVPQQSYRPSWGDIRHAYRDSWHLFAATMSTTMYLHTNALVLGLMRGPESVAIYSLANRLTTAVQAFVTPVAQAVFPRASILFAENPGEAWRLVKRIAAVMLPAVGVVSVLLVIYAPVAVKIIGGPSFASVVPVLRVMAFVPVLVTAATFLAQTIMVNIGLNKELFRVYLAVGLLNIALLPALVYFYDAWGAAFALLIAELLGPLLMSRTIFQWVHNQGK